MFRLILTTTEGEKIEEINEMIELSAVLEKYKDKYIGMQAIYLPGEVVKKIPEEEIKTEGKKYNTTTKITNFNVNWKNIKAACMTTISKDAGDKEPERVFGKMVEGASRPHRHEASPDGGGAEARRDVAGLADWRRTNQTWRDKGLFGICEQEDSVQV